MHGSIKLFSLLNTNKIRRTSVVKKKSAKYSWNKAHLRAFVDACWNENNSRNHWSFGKQIF